MTRTLSRPSSFSPARELLVPLLAAAAALACHVGGLDRAVAHLFFDPALNGFPARGWQLLETFGHRLAKSAVLVVWLVLLAASLASHAVSALSRHRTVLWATTAAMGVGPLAVSVLKAFTGPHCPWDLVEYGGQVLADPAFFPGRADAGRCFPSGHSSAGFSLIALRFAGLSLGNARLAALGTWLGLGAGTVFSVVRIVQGAHFPSHALWAGAVDWLLALAVFACVVRATRPAVDAR